MEASLDDKHLQLKSRLEEMGSALVAYSGGVDSTLVLAVAAEALGDNVVAATIQSPLHPGALLESAAKMAARLRVEHIIVKSDELENAEFTDNPPERCYLCKHDRFSKLVDIATREGMCEGVDGSQLDDTADYRPGLEAASELSVRSPLVEVGFYKYEVRSLSRQLGLATWNMEEGSCLATRIPYGETVTRDKLRVIEEGESFLSELGLSHVRVRYVEPRTARIEVRPSAISTLASDGFRDRVVEHMKALGFVYVTTDLVGYRTGSLNEILDSG